MMCLLKDEKSGNPEAIDTPAPTKKAKGLDGEVTALVRRLSI
jgi:hypothetical protein